MGLECGSIKGLEGVGRIGDGCRVIPKKYRRCGEGRVAADF